MPDGLALKGYEIHMGKTEGPDCQRPFAFIGQERDSRPDGACSEDGYVQGSYLHGLFSEDNFRVPLWPVLALLSVHYLLRKP